MKRTIIIAVTAVVVLTALVYAAGRWFVQQHSGRADPANAAAAEVHPSLLYGRITTVTGGTYEGRLRFGGGEEAFWGDYFNGVKKENPWAAYAPAAPAREGGGILESLGIGKRSATPDLQRPFMVRFGDIARLDADTDDVRVTLKSGNVWKLDRFSASDFDDGVRVWDATRGAVSLDTKWIRSIEFLPAPRAGAAPHRLHGTVRTRQGEEFTGFVQWNRQKSLGGDQLHGRVDGANVSLRFDTIRSIAKESHDSARVTLLDGREVVLSGSRELGADNRGMYVDDARYGRVLIPWDAFNRIDISAGAAPPDSGPAYSDFPSGTPLTGTVTTRHRRRLTGRLVYDLDETETSETLDAPAAGVDYTIPLGLIASLVPRDAGDRVSRRAGVTLHNAEQLPLERSGDLGDGNAGILIFVDGREQPEYVSWADVERIEFDRPPAMYPPAGG